MATADELIESMDNAGIDVSVVAAIGWTHHENCYIHNDYLMESVQKYPKRLVGLGMVQPLETELALKEIERIKRNGLKGVGEFRPDIQGVNLMDKNTMQPIMQALSENDMVLMLHASEPAGHFYPGKGSLTPEVIFPFIEQNQEARIILAHWGGGLVFYELQREVKLACRNVYYDTAATPFLYENSIYALGVELAGIEKVLFGSDYPLLGQKRALEHLSSGLAEENIKELLLGVNALNVI